MILSRIYHTHSSVHWRETIMCTKYIALIILLHVCNCVRCELTLVLVCECVYVQCVHDVGASSQLIRAHCKCNCSQFASTCKIKIWIGYMSMNKPGVYVCMYGRDFV